MVLFTNININQRVEVIHRGEIEAGKVKYKGPLNGLGGDWVGVDLNRAVGKHDGMLNGRRYFFGRPNHGIFTTADKIRFISIKRNSFDSYRPVSRQSIADEHLFTSYSQQVIDDERDPRDGMGWIRETHLDRATNDFRDRGMSREPRYNLNHSVSNHIPAQTMLRPQTSKARFIRTSAPSVYYSLNLDDDMDFMPFISSPSIPKPHMPRDTLARQVERGWEKDRYVREMSVHTGRDSIKLSQWNDIS